MSAERRVLVVDDAEAVCAVVADCFEDWPGTEVECAHDGHEGLKMLQAAKFDLALVDIMLPGLSGFDLAQAAINDDVPVLSLSGHPETTAKLVAADFPHLEKPFRMADLLHESQKAIANSQENVARVRASLAKLKERAEAVHDAMEETRRLLTESMNRLARAEGSAK